MTGLEKILKAIEDNAKASADAVIHQAEQEAEKIMTAAKEEAEEKCREIAAKSDRDIKAVLSRAESAGAIQERKMVLHAKQQIINEIIEKAKASLFRLSDSDYLDIILRIISKYAHGKAGEIVFSEPDLLRLPKDFNEQLKQVLSDKEGASLTLSKKTAALDGGFLLIYGEIEENCSFDALFSASRENLQDQVNAFLFG